MKFTVIGLVTCAAQVDVEADTFEEAISKAKTQCLAGNPIEDPDFEIQAVERRYDLEDSEEDEVSKRVNENESICSQMDEDADTSEDSTRDMDDEEALRFIKKLWTSKNHDPDRWFRSSDVCDCNKGGSCKGKSKKRSSGNISVYDTFPLFWGFDN